MPWYCYIIRTDDGNLYVGSTGDIKRRLQEHGKQSGSKFLQDHLPDKVVYVEEFLNLESAQKRERQIKGWRRKKKEDLIRSTPSIHSVHSGRALL